MTPAELCAHFIRFNTSNYGDGESLGETPLADEISRILRDSGYEPESYARAPHRASVAVRVRGSDSSLPGVLVHGHIDVVPAEPEQWTIPPFEGRIEDGYVFGRGAADMKHTVASMVTILLDWSHRSITPQRDVLFLFVADEEDTGAWGAGFLVDQHPELFTGIGAAIGESGGTATPLTAAEGSPVTLYPIAVAERGTLHLRLRAEGLSGHGSRPTPDSAVTKLIGAAYRINSHNWPLQLSDTVREYITITNEALGYEVDLSTESGLEKAIVRMGEAGDVARVTMRSSATVTVLQAGYKVNVIPGIAEAKVDARCVPGAYDSTLQTLSELIGPDVAYWHIDPGPPTNFSASSPWYAAMRNTVLRHDPDAIVAPYCMGGGTDAKHFMRLGMECFGFSPLTLDPEGRRVHGVHGIDERVAVASVNGGQEMLNDFLRNV